MSSFKGLEQASRSATISRLRAGKNRRLCAGKEIKEKDNAETQRAQRKRAETATQTGRRRPRYREWARRMAPAAIAATPVARAQE